MKVVALFRVSTEKQATDGASLDAQERMYRELANRNGWHTLREFRGCESATQASSDRRVLQDVLACIRAEEPDAIYVHEQSRLTRGDELETAMLLRELRERRVKILVGGVVRDLSSLEERFMVGIQSLVDRTESERIKERMQRGKKQRAMQGRKAGGPAPYGYRNPRPGEEGRGKLVPVPEKAAVVVRIFKAAADGMGNQATANELNESGLPAPRGGRWAKNTVRRILACPAYIGTSASGVWVRTPGTRGFKQNLSAKTAIVVENAHPAIVARELWDAANGRPRIPRTGKPRLLTGLLYVNGHRMEGNSDGGERFYSAAKGVRGSAWLEMAATDTAVWNAFVSLASTESFVKDLMAAANDPTEQEKLEQEISCLESEIPRVQRRLDNFQNMRADGELSKEEYAVKSADARKQIENLTRELADLRAKHVSYDGTAARRVHNAVRSILAGRSQLDQNQKRTLLLGIVGRIDAQAERSTAPLPRDARGRVLPSNAPRWTITQITFQVLLPGKSEAPAKFDGARHLATTC
ncbi:MAG: recombinase family protein [Planctomycetes bacterium]|nr:recombinase family protein [Planctomycetota bacterium]